MEDKRLCWSEKLHELMSEGKQGDIHAAMAAWFFNKEVTTVTEDERQFAKMLNFPCLYGNGRGL